MRLHRKLEQIAPVISLLEEIAKKHQATIAQVALSWLINYDRSTVVPIPGASTAS